MDGFMKINDAINGFVWGPVMLVLLVGCGVYLSFRMGFIQFTKFGFAMKNTLGKIFKKTEAGEGEVTLCRLYQQRLLPQLVQVTSPVPRTLSSLEVRELYSGCGFPLFSAWSQSMPR